MGSLKMAVGGDVYTMEISNKPGVSAGSASALTHQQKRKTKNKKTEPQLMVLPVLPRN